MFLLRALFWGLLALWLWRSLRRWIQPRSIHRSGDERDRPAPPPHRDGRPLTNQPIEDADYEELP